MSILVSLILLSFLGEGCSPGYVGSPCAACAKGTYDNGANACSSCPTRTTTAGTASVGSSSCNECDTGYVGVAPYCAVQYTINPDNTQLVSYAISPDGSVMSIQSQNGIYIYNLTSGSAPSHVNTFTSLCAYMGGNGAAFSYDGTQLINTASSGADTVAAYQTWSTGITNIWNAPGYNYEQVASSWSGHVVAGVAGWLCFTNSFQLWTYSGSSWSSTNVPLNCSLTFTNAIAVSGDGNVLAVSFQVGACTQVFTYLSPFTYPALSNFNPYSSGTFGDFVALNYDGTTLVVSDDGVNTLYIYTLSSGIPTGSPLCVTTPSSFGFTSFGMGINLASTAGLIVVSGGTSTDSQIATIAVSDGSVQFVGGGWAPAGITNGGGVCGGSSPQISDDGKFVAARDDSGTQVYVYQF